MKTKLSKRILSAFLAVMMMVTSVPMFALTAAAANSSEAVTDSYIEAAKNAMADFEAMLETPGAAFKNVTNAYNAFVACQEALDAYAYGDVTVSVLTNATDSLKTATAAVETFTGVTDAVNAKDASSYVKVWDGDSTDGYSTLYKNVLWSETNYSAERGSADGNYTKMIVYYPEVTFLYDGVNTPQATVRAIVTGGSGDANKTRYAYGVELTNTDGIVLEENWRGKDSGNRDVNWAWNYGTDRLSYTTTQNGASTYLVYNRTGSLFNYKYNRYDQNFSNIYKFVGSMDDSKLYTDITPSFKGYFGSNGTFKTSDVDLERNVTGNQAIHVVNYKALADAIARNGEKMKSVDFANYTQGGLSYYIAAMDAATGFNPLDWFTSSNNYTGCAGEISRLISVMDAADTSKTDDAAYANLRSAMESKRGDYNGGTQPADSTADSWAELKGAYEAARSIMAGLPSTGYNNAAGAQAAADRLNAAGLVFNTAKLDTTELEAVIDAFAGYESIFTEETKTAVDNAVVAAKVAVWGNVDNYPNTMDTINDTPENQAIYNQVMDDLNVAIKGLCIDPAATTMTAKGRYSLRAAIALGNSVNLDDFTNRAVFNKAVAEAEIYAANLSNVEFTDYAAQLAEYKSYIESVVTAFNSLKRPGDTFLGLPNGTVGQVGPTTQMTTLTTKDTYSFTSDFSYTSSAVVIRTSHDPMTSNYGFATAGATSDCDHTNSAIDSISINATASVINGQGGKNYIDGNKGGDTPAAMSDANKSTYAGCLTNGNFELKDIKYAGRSTTNKASQAFVLSDGSKISVADSDNYILDDLLRTTDGTASNPVTGAVSIAPNGKNAASAYVMGNLVLNLPATQPQNLSVTTNITKNTYVLDGYYGMVGCFNTNWGANGGYAGYLWLTSAATGERINSAVTVVDVSNLVDLVNVCNQITDPGKYTADSWARFETALADATGDTEDKDLTADQIEVKYSAKYSNLWSAYNALKLKDYEVLFKYMTADGVEKTLTLVPTHGEKLSKTLYLNKINSIETPDYTDGNYTMKFIGWSPEIDIDAEITGPTTYVAQYEPILNVADFTAFNSAKADLVNALADHKFTVNSLKAVADEVNKLVYFDSAAQVDVMADMQDAIDAETAILQAQLTVLKEVDYDKSVADAVKEQIAIAQKTDPDMYANDVTLDSEATVSVCGKDVIGLVFETQDDLDAAISEAVNAMSPIVYTIYLNGAPIGTGVYGEQIIVSSDGKIYNNVADYDSDDLDGEGWAAWNYHYKAKTSESVDKYMFTAKSIGFIVRGDAYITSTPADAPDSNYLVTIKDANSDKALLVETATGEYTLPKAPARPYYNFVNYVVDGATYKVGDKISVTANTTIEAVYTAREENTFDIIVYNGYNDCLDGNVADELNGLKYDEVVSFTDENAFCWADSRVSMDGDASYFTVLYYGTTYSFNVYKSMTDTDDYYGGLVSLTLDEYNELQREDNVDILETPDGVKIDPIAGGQWEEYVYSEAKPFVAAHNVPVAKYSESNVDKFTLIGFTAAPAGYTVVEHGFLFTKDTNVSQMTVEDVDMTNIFRLKSSVTTAGDQFVVDIKNPASTVNFKYSAYAIIKDADGNTSYIYSNILDGSNNF